MPMGTPTQDETIDTGGGVISPEQEKRAEYRRQGFKFDPETGQPLDGSTQTEKENTPESEDDFTHYVHLADGRVLKTKGVVTHYADSDDPNDRGVPVVAVYPRYTN